MFPRALLWADPAVEGLFDEDTHEPQTGDRSASDQTADPVSIAKEGPEVAQINALTVMCGRTYRPDSLAVS